MKKLFILLFALSLGMIAGCGSTTNDTTSEKAPAETTTTDNAAQVEKEQPSKDAAQATDEPEKVAVTPTEPGEGEMCSMCNMEVYHKDHPMGMYSGQVVTADGEHLFTDDLGCTINQVRILEEEPLAAWVRDYNTLEWIPVDKAIPVRASIETPMKMGFALFSTEEAANKFVTENPMLSPVLSTYEDVDKIALERRKAKLAKQKAAEEKQQQQGNMNGQMNGQMNGDMNGQMNH